MVLISIFFFDGAYGKKHARDRSIRRFDGMTGGCVTSSHHDGLVLDAELLHSGPVQLPQQAHDAGLLPRAGRPVDQQVRKVSSVDLDPPS